MNQELQIRKLLELRDGIYMVRTIMNGTHTKFCHERLEDLPDAMSVAAFEPYRNKIVNDFTELISHTDDPIKILRSKVLISVVDKVIRGK